MEAGQEAAAASEMPTAALAVIAGPDPGWGLVTRTGAIMSVDTEHPDPGEANRMAVQSMTMNQREEIPLCWPTQPATWADLAGDGPDGQVANLLARR